MARVVDLGWPMARCDGIELEIMEPESEDSPAKSFRISGLDMVRDLRDFLSECIADAEQRIELEQKGFDNPDRIE
jgi:hypothetical protein